MGCTYIDLFKFSAEKTVNEWHVKDIKKMRKLTGNDIHTSLDETLCLENTT